MLKNTEVQASTYNKGLDPRTPGLGGLYKQAHIIRGLFASPLVFAGIIESFAKTVVGDAVQTHCLGFSKVVEQRKNIKFN